MIKRKLFVEKQEQKVVEKLPTKKLKRGFDVNKLPDAIVDGKLICPIGSELVIKKYRNGKDVLVIHTLKKVDDDGLLHLWDEVMHQWFNMSLRQKLPDVVKVYFVPKVSSKEQSPPLEMGTQG